MFYSMANYFKLLHEVFMKFLLIENLDFLRNLNIGLELAVVAILDDVCTFQIYF